MGLSPSGRASSSRAPAVYSAAASALPAGDRSQARLSRNTMPSAPVASTWVSETKLTLRHPPLSAPKSENSRWTFSCPSKTRTYPSRDPTATSPCPLLACTEVPAISRTSLRAAGYSCSLPVRMFAMSYRQKARSRDRA